MTTDVIRLVARLFTVSVISDNAPGLDVATTLRRQSSAGVATVQLDTAFFDVTRIGCVIPRMICVITSFAATHRTNGQILRHDALFSRGGLG